jgi:anti-anti-sigma factor
MPGPATPIEPGTPEIPHPETAGPETPDAAAPAAPRLHITLTGSGEVVVAGEIDLATAPQLREELDKAAAHGASVLVDLTAVKYLDSAGVSVLFDVAYKDLRLRVTDATAVATVIRISGLIHVAHVEFVDSPEPR